MGDEWRESAEAKLLRIVAKRFVAGVELADGKVVRCAPIVKYMKGWALAEVEWYANERGWKVETL